MIRFILKREIQDQFNGLETVSYETIDIEIPNLEKLLTRGGAGENGYDYTDLAGFELLFDNNNA